MCVWRHTHRHAHTHEHTHEHAHILAPVMKYGACVDAALCRYPWHVVFTGLRILIESGGIFDGQYFEIDEDRNYTGYQ